MFDIVKKSDAEFSKRAAEALNIVRPKAVMICDEHGKPTHVLMSHQGWESLQFRRDLEGDQRGTAGIIHCEIGEEELIISGAIAPAAVAAAIEAFRKGR